ncbi:hypothetical protein P152DRAFT_507982 [Eremomyces bilateralis CBS 781.70]|uniref:Xylanolytic transcriptional activator regulatory domain-containing protein n=1 Tax=Eremomyces bilateralis CBS 781.70 TaxID=1392243 RepID=A0A6G1G1G4_9PEZI|nr:uncharacterized protein P152DRAFT_507982 [Eremomyces bilateralis CBS 781.70]KAF1811822.1 hypothetical protein P152DRAFT_507982 [Eremomyces bilateralis CBS 781.70]
MSKLATRPKNAAHDDPSAVSGVRCALGLHHFRVSPLRGRLLLRTFSPGQNGAPNSLRLNDIRPPSGPQGAQPDAWDLLHRVEKLEKSSTSSPISRLSETDRAAFAGQPDPQDSHIILDKTRFRPIIACYVAATGSWSGYAEATGSGPKPSFQGSEAEALTVQMADKMATLYFRSFESSHRILHAPTFWTEYQRFWSHPESITTALRLKILLVGLGSSLYGQEDASAEFCSLVLQSIYTTQTWLSGPLEKDRLDLTGLQIHCLMILARQIFSIGGDLVWISMGSLIHKAMQLGLHRDPKHLPKMSVLQSEIRRRIWATILEMTIQPSLDSEMPPRLFVDEFDTEAPSNVNDDEMDESTTGIQPHPKGKYTATSMQLILLDSVPTRFRILRLLNGLHTELSYLNVLTLRSELTEACRVANSFMKENGESGITTFHRNLLGYLVRRFLLPLHCPFATTAQTNPLFYHSVKVSLDAAMAIISPGPDEGFSRLMAISGGLFREGFRSAMTAITLELLVQVEAQRLDGTLLRNLQYRGLLKQAVKDIIELSAERIRQGETNFKSHMFLNMILSQVEAIETGTSCEIKISQSARDSLEFCHDLLRTRADTVPLPYPSDIGLTSTRPNGEQDDYGFDFNLDFFPPDGGFS